LRHAAISPSDCGSQALAAKSKIGLGFRLGKAEPVGNAEMRAGDGLDTVLGEEPVLSRVDASV
jgi:hypothetical protein